jgi:hypothetical protein
MKEFFTKQYAIYLARWIISAFVMMPIMLFLESILPLWGNLLVGQVFGSLIFFKIDKWIFKEDTEIDICIKHPHNDDPDAPYKVEPGEPSVSERKI